MNVSGPRACWRCGTTTGEFRETSHPDPAFDRRVLLCAAGCWLPPSADYRCHRCERSVTVDDVRLVEHPAQAGRVPECLTCNRAAVHSE